MKRNRSVGSVNLAGDILDPDPDSVVIGNNKEEDDGNSKRKTATAEMTNQPLK